MRLFKWIYSPSGYCPVQAEGYFLGFYFYFRLRWSRATIEFSKSELDWQKDSILKTYVLSTTNYGKAGWLNHNYAKWLIYKGCLKFLLKFKS